MRNVGNVEMEEKPLKGLNNNNNNNNECPSKQLLKGPKQFRSAKLDRLRKAEG